MNNVNEERQNTSDVGRMALLISELQRDVMEMGKHLGIVMQRLQTIDAAAGQRIAKLENICGCYKPVQQQAAQPTEQANPKVLDLRPGIKPGLKVEVQEVDKPGEKEPA